MRCFNGAAGVNPRIAAMSDEMLSGRLLLQWGRGCEPADRRRRMRGGEKASSSLQWGRGCEPADRGCRVACTIPTGTGFNGAAGVNPRIGDEPVAIVPETIGLQWGRGCEPADSTERAGSRGGAIKLQWGRGCEPADSPRSGPETYRSRGFNGAAGVNPRIGHRIRLVKPGKMAASMGPRV